MTRQTLIEHASLDDVARLVERKLVEAVFPLQQEVERLRVENAMLRRVVSTKQAVYLFDDDVTEETVKDYIRYWGLPAFRRGHKWFLYRRDIEDFQVGAIGFGSKRNQVTIVTPRQAA